MEINIKVSGKLIKEMEKVFSFGKTAANSKETGKTTKKKEVEFTPDQMATHLLEHGIKIK